MPTDVCAWDISLFWFGVGHLKTPENIDERAVCKQHGLFFCLAAEAENKN